MPKRKLKPDDIQVGQRYVLKMPSNSSLPAGDPVGEVYDWITSGGRVDGKEPDIILGHGMVTVLGLGEILDPPSTEDSEDSEASDCSQEDGDPEGDEPPPPPLRWDRRTHRKHPVPAAKVHLARRTRGPVLTVALSAEEKNDLKLPVFEDYFVTGRVCGIDGTAEVVEERDLLIPLRWLIPIEDVDDACSRCGLPSSAAWADRDVRLCSDCSTLVIQEGQPLPDGRVWSRWAANGWSMSAEALAAWTQEMTDLDEAGEVRQRCVERLKTAQIPLLQALCHGWGLNAYSSRANKTRWAETAWGAWHNYQQRQLR
jgi:hypothetical protein